MTAEGRDDFLTVEHLRRQARAVAPSETLAERIAALEVQLGLVAEADATLGAAVREFPRSLALRLAWVKTAILRSDFAAALQRCKAAQACEPLSPHPIRLKARILELLGRDDDAARARRAALSALRAACRRKPFDAELRRLEAQDLLAAGRFAQAEESYRRLVELSPSHADALTALGQLELWRGRSAAARRLADLALAAAPDHKDALRTLAAAAVAAGRFSEGLALLNRLLSLFPTDGEGYAWRAEAHFALGRVEEALRDGDHALEFSDNSLGVNVSVARLKLEAGRTVSAIEYSLVVRLLPPSWRKWSRQLSTASPRTSLRALERILAGIPGNRGQRRVYLRGPGLSAYESSDIADEMERLQARLRAQAPAAVFREFGRRMRKEPKNAWINAFRGETRLWTGDYAGAAADFHSALAKDATIRWPHIGLCAAAMLEGRFEEALAHCGDAVRDKAPERSYLHWRGEIRRKTGRMREAASDLRRGLHLLPARLSARLNLLLCAETLNEKAEAASQFSYVCRAAPHFMTAAARSAGQDAPLGRLVHSGARAKVAEAGLSLMLGNRSSWMPTYKDARGGLRGIPIDIDDEIMDS